MFDKLETHHHHHYYAAAAPDKRLDRMLQLLEKLTVTTQEKIEQILAEVRGQKTEIASLRALMSKLRDQIFAIIPADPALRAQIDEVFNELQANDADLAALKANVSDTVDATAPTTTTTPAPEQPPAETTTTTPAPEPPAGGQS